MRKHARLLAKAEIGSCQEAKEREERISEGGDVRRSKRFMISTLPKRANMGKGFAAKSPSASTPNHMLFLPLSLSAPQAGTEVARIHARRLEETTIISRGVTLIRCTHLTASV